MQDRLRTQNQLSLSIFKLSIKLPDHEQTRNRHILRTHLQFRTEKTRPPRAGTSAQRRPAPPSNSARSRTCRSTCHAFHVTSGGHGSRMSVVGRLSKRTSFQDFGGRHFIAAVLPIGVQEDVTLIILLDRFHMTSWVKNALQPPCASQCGASSHESRPICL